MSRLLVPRMLATGTLVGAATAARAGSRCALIVVARTPPLLTTAVCATAGAAKAQWTFRDELLALARETADISWRELRRGLDEFDARTRPPGTGPRRPYRAKP